MGLGETIKDIYNIFHGKSPDKNKDNIVTEPRHKCTVTLKDGEVEVEYCVKKDVGASTVFYGGYDSSFKIPVDEIKRFKKEDIISITNNRKVTS
jgi:hypothetical protein